jgi:hypothetical protein
MSGTSFVMAGLDSAIPTDTGAAGNGRIKSGHDGKVTRDPQP